MRTIASFRIGLATSCAFAAIAIATPASAQDQTTQPAATPTGAEITTDKTDKSDNSGSQDIVVTGSRIKQDPNNSALPLQIITLKEIDDNAISSPEQLVAFIPSNGTGADNLASNSDVVDATRRGNNGVSFANLRGQGAGATLVLLNGRRVAAHGLTGAAVDVNQIPFMAIERVEVLKDGASAIYGTDAVGGVINFITKKNYRGIGATGSADITQEGGAPIYRLSAIAGFGDLDEQGFNIMATVGYTDRGSLQANQRSFVNGFQHDKGLGIDTRGTPFATIFPLAGTVFPSYSSFPNIPGTNIQANGGINVLHLPGQPGCDSIPYMADYDTDVWGAPGRGLACTFDTGRNVYLQQPITTLTYYGRGTLRLGASEAHIEVTGSNADSNKRFSQIQITPRSGSRDYAYRPVTGVNIPEYNRIWDIMIANFPELNTQENYNKGFSYRWRCMECGERELITNNKTFRIAAGLDGPLFSDWDYSIGVSYADSRGRSTTGQGYYYQDALIAALNSGYVNPFLFPGQTQSAEGMAALQAAQAYGVTLYSGKYSVKQADASVSGSLFDLPNGAVKLAAGVDYRREEYQFTGDTRADRRTIYAAPFDNGNALDGVHRDVKAAYAELLVPLLKGMELSAAGRIDDYTGFGTTTNPKLSLKYRPWEPVMFRASYSTAFRVPNFNQIFNPRTPTPYLGADYADPAKCPGGVVNASAGCPALDRSFDVIFGGNPNLGPETADEYSAGIVIEPSRHLSFSADWWKIKRKNRIQTIPLNYLFANYEIFKDRFIYDSAGNLSEVDDSYGNTGTSNTEGIDFTLRGRWPVASGNVSIGMDATWLLAKSEQVNASSPVIDELGVYSLANDLGLRWKHNAYVSWSNENWGATFTQIYRSGYKNQQLPGVASGTFTPCCAVTDVSPYIIYNLTAFLNITHQFRLTAGIKNLFNTKPPFAISYDSNYGSGSNWEPRVADPRLRSFTIQAEVKF